MSIFVAAFAAAFGLAVSGGAQTLTTLHAFCTLENCADGAAPEKNPLILGPAGELVGTTAGPTGTLFRMSPQKDGTYSLKTLFTFCQITNCPDGRGPNGSLVRDVDGNFYGVTASGGHVDNGVVYKLSHNPDGRRWKLDVLHVFCATDCSDGRSPYAGLTYAGASAGLPYDGVSPLFGTTAFGGAQDDGTVYEMLPPTGENHSWSEAVIHDFCSDSNCSDGSIPFAELLMDGSGALYGTTIGGGGGNTGLAGTVFKLTQGKSGKWSETVLYSFCDDNGCPNGSSPWAGLIMDASGNLYGEASSGGEAGLGTVFELRLRHHRYEPRTLYAFCKLANCEDGSDPQTTLSMNSAGTIFGSTSSGGASNAGTLFELSPRGDRYHFSILHSFCTESDCADGNQPYAAVTIDPAGKLFGTTIAAGAHNQGTVFEFVP